MRFRVDKRVELIHNPAVFDHRDSDGTHTMIHSIRCFNVKHDISGHTSHPALFFFLFDDRNIISHSVKRRNGKMGIVYVEITIKKDTYRFTFTIMTIISGHIKKSITNR